MRKHADADGKRIIPRRRSDGIRETVHVSELLEIPTLVAGTDLLGVFAASMGALMEQRLGLQVLPLPLGSPSVPIYMIWHETRRHDTAHRWLREMVVAELGRFGNAEQHGRQDRDVPSIPA